LQIYIHFLPNEISEAIQLLNSDILAISEWATANGLNLNPAKTQLILLVTKKNRAKVSLNGLTPVELNYEPIPFNDCVKNLGVIMDPSYWRTMG